MAVLLIGPPADVGEHLVVRLVDQGDQVRVLEAEGEPDRDGRWRALGAHVAHGGPDDADIVMRAALGVRTAVAFWEWGLDEEWIVAPLAEGLRGARVTRVVLVAPVLDEGILTPFKKAGFEYLALSTGARRGLLRNRKSAVDPSAVAEAIDAADDLAGEPRLTLDLTAEEGWRELKLAPHIPR